MKKILILAVAAIALVFHWLTGLAAAQELSRLTDTKVSIGQEWITVEFVFDAPAAAKAFALSDPPRLVVDFAGSTTTEALAEAKQTFDDALLLSLRTGRFKADTARVVLDLARGADWRLEGANGARPKLLIERNFTDSRKDSDLAPGVKYHYQRSILGGEPTAWHVLEIELDAAGLQLAAVPADPKRIRAKAPLSSIVKKAGGLGGINGGYFDVKSGQPIDLLIVNRKIHSLPSRYRAALAIDNNGRPQIFRPNIGASLQAGDGKLVYVDGLNRPRQNAETVLFTSYYGDSTGSAEGGYELAVDGMAVTAVGGANTPIPDGGFVVSVGPNAPSASDLRLEKGDTVRVVFSAWPDLSSIRHAISAGPTLVEYGKIVKFSTEDFTWDSSILKGRHPRSAVGLTKEGKLLLLAAEGRSESSAGMTLEQLARVMREYGAVMAMNLDGGGSTELAWGGKVFNELSDGNERPLANALVLVKKK